MTSISMDLKSICCLLVLDVIVTFWIGTGPLKSILSQSQKLWIFSNNLGKKENYEKVTKSLIWWYIIKLKNSNIHPQKTKFIRF